MIPSRRRAPLALGMLLVACGSSESAPPENRGLDGGVADALSVDALAHNDAPNDARIASDAPQATTNAPGRHDHTIVVDGVSREYIVYVPEKARANRAPVVLMFHGTSQDGEKFYSDSGWREKADETGLIAVFPTALTYCYKEDENGDGDFDDPGEPRISTKWTHGKLGVEDGMPLCSDAERATFSKERQALADHPLKDDILFVDAMLAQLAHDYVVDEKRVYATGFSNGSAFTGRLVQERSTRIAAAGAGSGLLSVPPTLAERPMTVAHWVGSKDNKFVPDGVEIAVRESALTEYPKIKAAFIDRYLTTLGLADKYVYAERTVGQRKVATFTYSTSTVGGTNTFVFSLLEGMFHVYPNGSNYPVVAADVLWNVFEPESLP